MRRRSGRNNAILYAPSPADGVIRRCLEHLCAKGCGFGFQLAELTYDSPVPLLVLPCAWFDPRWLEVESGAGSFSAFFSDVGDGNTVTLESFYPGAFAYHWHNQWDSPDGERSPFAMLAAQIDQRLVRHCRPLAFLS